MNKNAIILVGEIRSYDLVKSRIDHISKSNNCDIYAVLTNYKNQRVPDIKNIKILTSPNILDKTFINNYITKVKENFNYNKWPGRPTEFVNSLNASFFTNQFMQVYLYSCALDLVIESKIQYKNIIKLRPDVLFNYNINLFELFDYDEQFFNNCMRTFTILYNKLTVNDHLLLFVLFRNNFQDIDKYLEITNNLQNIKIPDKNISFTYTEKPFDSIFMGLHYKEHSVNIIKNIQKELQNNYKLIKNITNKQIYMFHDFGFATTFDNAKKYVRTTDDYFKITITDSPYFFTIEDIIYNHLYNQGLYPLFLYGPLHTILRTPL